VLPQFRLVPLMLGDTIADPGAPARLEQLAAALAALWTPDTLIIVSTDLTHDDDYAEVVRRDRRLAELAAAFDVPGLTRALVAEQVQACGATGLVAAFRAAETLGAKGATVLAQTTSGDVTGRREPGAYTVGYLAAAIYG
jgi:AmmeMemoRadiSam system protein B